MKPSGQHIAIALSLVSLGVLIYFLFPSDRGVQWMETYKNRSEQPYGTYLIYELLKETAGGYQFDEIDKPLAMVLDEKGIEGENVNYVFIGEVPYISESGQKKLLEFVERGNTALMITGELPSYMASSPDMLDIGDDTTYLFDYHYADSVQLGFYHPDFSGQQYELIYIQEFEPANYYWSYLMDEMADGLKDGELSMLRLGYMNGGDLVFFSLKYGKGQFIFHTLPLAFTNYHMRDSLWLDYAEKVFAHMPEGDIIWDENSKIYTRSQSGDINFSRSPLEFILSQTSLRWSWYLLLALVMLYVLFRSKRTQRIIPLLEPYLNTSLEFVQVIGKLHYQERDHKQLALEKMKLFLADMRGRYRISTREINEGTFKMLALKAGVPQAEVEKIFKIHRSIENSQQISPDTLKHFYLAIEKFYKMSK